MLKQRFFTALVLIPLVLLLIKQGSPWILGAVTMVCLIAAGLEWLRLIPLTNPYDKGLVLLFLLAASWLCSYWFASWLLVGLVMWGLVVVAVLMYPRSQQIWGTPLIVGCTSVVFLPLAVGSIQRIYYSPQGPDLIIYLFFLVWAADIGAYFAGKKWGAHRLIVHVSPGKTIEGVVGGYVLAMLVAFGSLFWFSSVSWMPWLLLATAVVSISVFGDLFISMLKRRSQLKDTGALFPGHGGILDRLDSFIAAAPVFCVGLRVWFNDLT